MPIEACSQSEHVAFVLTKHGSHCGHMKGLWPWKQSWLDALVMQFFATILAGGQPGSGESPPEELDAAIPGTGSSLLRGDSADEGALPVSSVSARLLNKASTMWQPGSGESPPEELDAAIPGTGSSLLSGDSADEGALASCAEVSA